MEYNVTLFALFPPFTSFWTRQLGLDSLPPLRRAVLQLFFFFLEFPLATFSDLWITF